MEKLVDFVPARLTSGQPPRPPIDLARRPDGHIVIGDAVIFSGRAPGAGRLPARSAGPHIVILHALDARLAETWLVMADQPELWTRAHHHPVVGLALPAHRLPLPANATSMQLTRTPLVRVSRIVLPELLATTPTPRAVAPIEDFLFTLMQGILRENPRVVTGAPRDALVPTDISALIDARHHDPLFDVATMARELHISRRQLYRHAPSGMGLAEMIAERRLQTAITVMREQRHLMLSTVARLSGFRDAASMRVQFLRRRGVTPSQYRESEPARFAQ